MIGILRDQDLSIGVRKFGRRFTASGAGALSWEIIESLRRHPPSISPCKQDLLQSFFSMFGSTQVRPPEILKGGS